MGVGGQRVAGAVAADVSVQAQAQDLDIQTARRQGIQILVKAEALCRGVLRQTVGHTHPLGGDAYMVQEKVPQDDAVALGTVRAVADDLLQVIVPGLGKDMLSLLIEANQLLKQAHGRLSGSEADMAAGLFHQLGGQELGGGPAHFFIVLIHKNFHREAPSVLQTGCAHYIRKKSQKTRGKEPYVTKRRGM